jgi:ATP-dependent Clp protease adapter protein ClpS
MTDQENEISSVTIEDLLEEKKLILFNCNKTSFLTVITALCLILGFDKIQAEQLSLIVHNKGKAVIKTGEYLKLKDYYEKLKEFGLTLKIE